MDLQKTGEYDEPFGQYRQADKRVKGIGQTVLKKTSVNVPENGHRQLRPEPHRERENKKIGVCEMTIYVDADACPVTRIAEDIARKHGIPVTLLCDTNHQLTSDYSTVKVIGAGADAVDIALINLCKRGDIVVTQDYGVAALALGKGAKAIHQSGKWYTDDNIDGLLMERHLAKKARRSGKHHLKGPAKRTEEDDRHFAESFERLIQEALNDRSIVE